MTNLPGNIQPSSNFNVPVSPAPSVTAEPATTPTISRRSVLPGIFLLLLTAGLGGMLVLPNGTALPVLCGILALILLFVFRDAEFSLNQLPARVRQMRQGRALLDEQTLTRQKQMSILFAFASLGMMYWAALLMRPGNNATVVSQGIIAMVVGGGLLWTSLGLTRREMPGVVPAASPLSPARSRAAMTALGMLLLLLLAEINGRATGIDLLPLFPHRVQFIILVGGIFFLVWGLSGIPNLSNPFRFRTWSRLKQGTVLWLLAIFALALVLRTVNIGSDLRGSVDEALVVNSFNHVTGTKDAGLVTMVSAYHATTQVFSYVQTELVPFTGRTLGGFRLLNAIIGSLTVFAVYLLTEALYDRRTGLIAAFMLAVLPPHIHFSRVAMAHIADPMFGALTFAFIARGLKHNRRLDWALAGVCLGMTQYFFEVGRLLFPILTVAWVIMLVIVQKRRMVPHIRGLMLMAIASFLVMMPYYYTVFARDLNRNPRLEASGVGSAFFTEILEGGISLEDIRTVGQRFLSPLLIYVHNNEQYFYYGGPTAMITETVAPLFLLACFYLIWRWNKPDALLAVWIILVPVANGFAKLSLVYARYIVVLPVLAVVLAVGITHLLPLLVGAYGETRQRLSGQLTAPLMRRLQIATVVLVAVIAVFHVNYYFGTHVPYFAYQLRTAKPYRDGFDAVMRSVDIPRETTVYLISEPKNDRNVLRPFFGFFAYNDPSKWLEVLSIAEFNETVVAGLERDRNYVFFVEPGDQATVELLSKYFALTPPEMSPYEDVPLEREYVMYRAYRYGTD